MKSLRSLALTLCVVGGLVSAASAQTAAPRSFSSYFFFGDSLSDNGNTFAITGIPPAPYFNGRFSNGPTFPEYLKPGVAAHTGAGPTVRTNLDFAFGGATAAPGSLVPNLGLQLGFYQARGITAGGNDLFVVLAGANDLLDTVANPATQNGPALVASGVRASQAVAGAVRTLGTLGAKNIFVLNLPDIARTARFVTGTGAPAATLVQGGVVAFNQDITGQLSTVALAPDVRLTLFNLNGIFTTILDNGPLFGLTNTRQEFLGLLAAGQNPGDVNGFLFWDGIHPTTKVHQIVANAAVEALNPELVLGTAGVQGTAGLTSLDLAADNLDSRLDLTRQGGAGSHRANGFVNYAYKDGGRDAAGLQTGFDYEASVFTAGFDVRLSPALLVGLAASKDSLSAELAAGAGSFRISGEMITGYAQWTSGAFFAEASAGYGASNIRSIARTTALGGLVAGGRTDSDRYAGSLKLGANLGNEMARLAPFVQLRYARVEADAYTERGVPGLNFAFEGQTADALDGVFGLNGDWRLQAFGHPLGVNLSAAYQTSLSSGDRTLAGHLAETVATRVPVTVKDGLEDSLKFGIRFTGAFSRRWGWTVGYLAEVRNDGDTASQASFAVHTGF